MSDDYGHGIPQGQAEALLEAYGELSPRDQELVMALMSRLRWSVAEPDSELPRDVAFMDFDE